ncbi:cbb3-type cytochrome c oxidase subunit I, partial [candidate division KSB1 bacterium]|nr:cbb3-type cytochrome c oxidase subunit I [candidate division KSB1 bacterium]
MISAKVRAILLFLLVLAFGVLIFGGYLINKEKPPIPEVVKTETGEVVFTGKDIIDGQNYYFSRGGQHIGTIWGHGSYLAPDWSADYLHRLGLFIAARYHNLDVAQAESFSHQDFETLDQVTRANLSALVQQEVKTNRYQSSDETLIFTQNQADVFKTLTTYYTQLFQNGNERMGLQPGIVRTAEEGRIITAFFAWLAWAAGTNRLDKDYTYTTNWPFDPLVGNQPVPDALMWSILSVILLILAIAVALFVYLRYIRDQDYEAKLLVDFQEPAPTASQKATLPYFLVASLLLIAQIGLGAIIGHYAVEGTRFYGIPLASFLPYAIARTWHLQMAIFWIATCFLAAGLFIGPFIGKEPKKQGLLTWNLFGAVAVVLGGTLVGTWLSVTGRMNANNFLLGHQGYEYIELGRVWQLLLIAGMIIWLFLVVRAIRPA